MSIISPFSADVKSRNERQPNKDPPWQLNHGGHFIDFGYFGSIINVGVTKEPSHDPFVNNNYTQGNDHEIIEEVQWFQKEDVQSQNRIHNVIQYSRAAKRNRRPLLFELRFWVQIHPQLFLRFFTELRNTKKYTSIFGLKTVKTGFKTAPMLL